MTLDLDKMTQAEFDELMVDLREKELIRVQCSVTV